MRVKVAEPMRVKVAEVQWSEPEVMSKLERAAAFEAASQYLEIKTLQAADLQTLSSLSLSLSALRDGARQLRSEYARERARPITELHTALSSGECGQRFGPDEHGRYWKVEIVDVEDGPRGVRKAVSLVQETFK